MQVVAAGMHYGNIAAAIILGADLAGVSQAGFLFDWQAVQFCAQHNCGTCAIFHDCDDPIAANVLRDFIAKSAQALGHHSCCARFMRRKFRMLVKVEIQGVSVRKDRVNLAGKGSVLGGAGQDSADQEDSDFHSVPNIERKDLLSKTATMANSIKLFGLECK